MRKILSALLAICLFPNLLLGRTDVIEGNSSGFSKSPGEPTIRVGLMTDVATVTVTADRDLLLAYSPGEAERDFKSRKLVLQTRSYRPLTIDFYLLDVTGFVSEEDASSAASKITDSTGYPTATIAESDSGQWTVAISDSFAKLQDASAFEVILNSLGFRDVSIRAERTTRIHQDALLLSEQIKSSQSSRTEIRSLLTTASSRGNVASSTDFSKIDPSIREIVAAGDVATNEFSSLRPVIVESADQSQSVNVNGRPYRGRIEVFVNSKGNLTVVNEVSMEDYLLSVVPKELGLPSLEAQKAQAIAARTYALSNGGRFLRQGFDILPTVSSQVYGGREAETSMGTRAVRETSGIIAEYGGRPINALYTSTCGGRTEDSENIFDRAEPYLRGVECSLEGRGHFDPFTIKSLRELPRSSSDEDLESIRLAAMFATNGFLMVTDRFDPSWFEIPPNEQELRSWINQIATRFGGVAPAFSKDLVKGEDFAMMLAQLAFGQRRADVLMSESDIRYHLGFNDGSDISATKRADIAMLFREGLLSLYPDGNFHPHRPMSRDRILRLIRNIYAKKGWGPQLMDGVARPSVDGKLVIRAGNRDSQFDVSPNVFLFRQFGDVFIQVREFPMMGGERVSYAVAPSGEITYLEIRPTTESTVAEKMSPFTNWTETVSASDLQKRLSRYIRNIGSITDIRISKFGSSRRATEIEVIGTSGRQSVKGGRIRSALGLREQLFVVDANKDASGKTISFTFTGRGWGHGVGMCQYGAFGLARMGLRHDEILKHYYSGIELVKRY